MSPAHPKSCTDLFMTFLWMALQGFGGVLAVVQRELVENKRWLTRDQFVEEWSVAQALPGPNVINLGIMLGSRSFGLRGSLASLAGLLLVPCALVLLLAAAYDSISHMGQAQAAMRGMGAVVAGMVIATGLKMVSALRKNPVGFAAALVGAACSFVCVAILRWPLFQVLLLVGGVYVFWAYQRLKKNEVSS